MKKIYLLFVIMCLQISSCFAATHLKVVAMDEFKTESPAKELNVRVVEEATLGNYDLGVNSILHCQVLKIIDPKRGKRNAYFFVKPISYTTNDNTTCLIEEDMYGKYSKFVLSKEEIKKIPPTTVIKKAALTVGDYFVKGLSICYSFVEGVVKNEKDDNRLKSGVKNAYEESPLSLISEGEQLDIKVGDDFYLVFKTKEDEEEPNYEYTTEENNNKDKKPNE